MKEWIMKNRCGLIVAFVAAIILLPFLGMAPLIDPDEPVYGETAREMLLAGDWLSPRIFGQFWYDKPPLFYWLEMIFYSFGGISDVTSRLPSALLGMATAVYVYWQGKELFNKPIAYMSALLLVTSAGFMYIGKAAVTDMTLMFTLTVAMISFYRQKYYLAYIFCGLSLLAKGPIGYAFPALIILIYLACTRQLSQLKHMKLPQGILLAFLIGLPWYGYMYHVHGEVFLDTFIGYHNFTRFAAPEHPGQNSLLFYVPILFAAMMPWTVALFPTVHRLFKKRDPFKDFLLYCLIWSVFIFVFFSVSKTQLVTYIAPLFPPTAYLLGWYWYRCYIERHVSQPLIVVSCLLGLVLLACNAIPLHPGAAFFHPAIAWGTVLLSLALFLPAYYTWRRKFRFAFWTGIVTMIIFSWSAFGLVIPHFQDYITSYRTAQSLEDVYDGHSPLYIEKFLRPGIAYYNGRYGEEWNPENTAELDTLYAEKDKIYLIMTKSTFDKLAKHNSLIDHFGIALETPGQVILINHP